VEGEHEAIIDAETWEKVQAQLAANAGRQRGRTSSKHPSLLAGLLFTAEDAPFTPSYAVNHSRRYRYYVERSLVAAKAEKHEVSYQGNRSEAGLQAKGWRLPAHEIEQLVLSQLSAFLRDRGKLLGVLPFKKKSPDLVSAMLTRAAKLANACETGSPASQAENVAVVAQDKVTIEVERKTLSARLLDREVVLTAEAKGRSTVTLEVPVRFRRRGVEAKLVVLNQQDGAAEPDANLVKALARAHEWFGQCRQVRILPESPAFGLTRDTRALAYFRSRNKVSLVCRILGPISLHAPGHPNDRVRAPLQLKPTRLILWSRRKLRS
jgi:site-specific DNA recombinase